MTSGVFYLMGLRLLHVALGAFWVGAGLFAAWFLAPAVRAAGSDGGKVMGKLQTSTRWSTMIASAAGLTVLSGILLYVRNWLPSMATGPAIGYAVGGIVGLAAAIHGGGVVGRLSRTAAERGEALQAADRPPTPEEIAEMNTLREKLDNASRHSAILLTIAILLMAIARYLPV